MFLGSTLLNIMALLSVEVWCFHGFFGSDARLELKITVM